MASKIRNATGDQVRAWAKEQGIEVGERGRFAQSLQDAFNKAHKGQARYAPGNVKMVDLKVSVTSQKTGKVRKEMKSFTPDEVRDLARETEGLTVPSRGPFSKAVLAAAAENYKG